MNYVQPTAILFFTRTPEEEARHKTFVPARRRTNRQVARELIKHTHGRLVLSGLPVYVVDSDLQVGTTFGERLAHAFQRIYALGYENVIAVGNDTLSLSSSDLTKATDLLGAHTSVIGPTSSGGAYLIGLHRSVFSALDFENLPWETEALFDALTEGLLSENTSTAFLDCLRDINDLEDFHEVLQTYSRHTTLYKTLQGLLATPTVQTVVNQIQHPLKRLLRNCSHRAPPTHLSFYSA